MSDLAIVISKHGPVCPHCAEDGFDDWHHGKGLTSGNGAIAVHGALKCHSCGKFFKIEQYHDGECHCSAKRRSKS